MKPPSIATIYALTAAAFIVPWACSTPPAEFPELTPKAADCQYHVIEKYVGGNEQLINRVLSVPRGEARVEELVQVLLELDLISKDIVQAGEDLYACLPKKIVAPIPDAGNKVL